MFIARQTEAGSEPLGRLRELIERQRPAAARPLLNALVRLLPEGEELAELEARLLLLEGNAAGACASLDAAVARAPASPLLRLARATMRAQAGDTEAAARDAAEAVVLDPTQARAKALLGTLLKQLGRHTEARACLEEAVAAAPDDAGYRRQLAAAHEAGGDRQAAAATLEEGLARAPADVGLRSALILSRMRHGDFAGAEALALAACRAGVADACLFGLLGHARSSLGRHADAAEAYAEARKLAPEDPYVRHLAAAGGLAPDVGRASTDYVRTVFDGYARRFDTHLITLGYRIPGAIKAELARLGPWPRGCGPLLDLGCGTGLLAVAAAEPDVGPWIGVDLSPAMLAEAERRGLYAELHAADIAAFLATETRQFPVILAGDVLPYFGDLAPLLRQVAARLTPGGRFLFSVEHLADSGADGPPWQLGRLGRYAHGEAHVAAAAAAAGLRVALLRAETVRLEVDVPVAGLFVTLERLGA
jgi:predicted TPR repeat methyltransferase